MTRNITTRFLIAALATALLAMPILVNGQTKPTMHKKTKVVKPLVPVGTNLKIRLDDTLSSKQSSVGDRFTATALDPIRFNEGAITGHISSIKKSGKVKGSTSMNLAFDSIRLRDGRSGKL